MHSTRSWPRRALLGGDDGPGNALCRRPKGGATVKQLSPSSPVIMLTGWGQGLDADSDGSEHVDEVLKQATKLRDLRQALLRHGGSVPVPSSA